MGTRAGDMDPAIVGIIMQMKGYDPQQIDTLLNKESGLLGLTGVSSDMRDVKAAALADPPNPRAVAALEVFCYRIVKYFGAYAAALGGLDAIVFTAGIGENEPMVRERTTSKLGFLGIGVDPAKNAKVDKSQDVIDISAEGTTVSTIIIPTNEELMIARDTAEIVSEKSS
jgi:acetate kinase